MSRHAPRVDRRWTWVAAVGMLLLALVGSSLASASALTVTSRLKPFAMSQSRCTSQSVAVTNPAVPSTTSSVVVSNVDTAGCAGRPLVVTVYDPAVGTWPAASRLVASGTVGAATTATLTAASGSFTPAVGLKVHVTVGGWQVPATWTRTPPPGPVNTCEVRNANGTVDTTTPCTVTGPVTSNYWGSSGSGQGNWRTEFRAPGIDNEQYIAFTVTLSGTPGWWSWASAGVKGANNSAALTSSCSALPVVSGRLNANIGPGPDLFMDVVEKRAGVAGIQCQVP